MTKDEALKLALEALRLCTNVGMIPMYLQANQTAITAIKEALAQPEQEPVATDWERIARVQNAKLMAMCNEAGGFEKLCEVMDKYEQATPPQRTWVGLTDEEVDDFLSALWPVGAGAGELLRAIEAKLKEKNT